MNRPMIWMALAFTVGIACAGNSTPQSVYSMSAFALIGASSLLLIAFFPHRSALALCMIFFAAGGLWCLQRLPHADSDALFRLARAHPEARIAVEGYAYRPQLLHPGDTHLSFYLRVKALRINGQEFPARGKIAVSWTKPQAKIFSDQYVALTGAWSTYLSTVNHDLGNLEQRLHNQGVFCRIRTKGDALKTGASRLYSPFYWASRLRSWEAQVLRKHTPKNIQAFLFAVWIGDRGKLSASERQAFVDSGTAHILSVSGVHTGIIFLSIQAFLQLIIRSRKWRAILAMGGALGFALVAGARIPSLRAALMVALYLTADLFDREPDAPTALSLSALLFFFWNPLTLFDPAFQLSYLSVASLLIFTERFQQLLPWAPWWLRASMAASISVQLLVLPIAAAYFHLLPVLGPLVNLVAIPLLTLILWLNCLLIAAALLAPPLALLLGYALEPLVLLMRLLVSQSAALPFSHLDVFRPTLWAMVLYWLGGLLLLVLLDTATGKRGLILEQGNQLKERFLETIKRFITRKPSLAPMRAYHKRPASWWLWGSMLACYLSAFLCWEPFFKPVSVDFLDVGHADAAFLRAPGGRTWLIDGGDRSEFFDAGERVVAPFLRANYVRTLDYLVLSHPDRDHLGGLFCVLEEFRVKQVLMGPESNDNELARAFLRRCKEKEIPVERLHQGMGLEIAGGEVQCLHPPQDWRNPSSNEQSLVLRFSLPELSILFTGDVEADAEYLIAEQPCQATVLKTPHHGSITSSSQAFLEQVDPRYAIVSTRATGKLKAIHPTVEKRYRDLKIALWRTDFDGGIRLRYRHGAWRIAGARGRREER